MRDCEITVVSNKYKKSTDFNHPSTVHQLSWCLYILDWKRKKTYTVMVDISQNDQPLSISINKSLQQRHRHSWCVPL